VEPIWNPSNAGDSFGLYIWAQPPMVTGQNGIGQNGMDKMVAILSDTFYSSLKTLLFSRARVGSASE